MLKVRSLDMAHTGVNLSMFLPLKSTNMSSGEDLKNKELSF